MSFFSLFSRDNYYHGGRSNHFDGTRFLAQKDMHQHSIWSFLRMSLREKAGLWPKQLAEQSYDQPPERVFGDALRVSNVGHVTFLIQTHGLNILTDPVWSKRASPLSWVGPRRIVEPGIRFEELPPIDLVLVSHNHYDHLDLVTLERLWKEHRPHIIAPLGNDKIIQAGGCPDIEVTVADWGEMVSIQSQDGVLRVHLEPAQHWSARGLFDRNKALWSSFNIETPSGNIYFVGDSGYGEGQYFREARAKHKQFRLALLPMGAYAPRWFMNYAHMCPQEMVQAHHDLGAPFTIPSHYDVFRLALEGYGEALRELENIGAAGGMAIDKIRPLAVGKAHQVPLL